MYVMFSSPTIISNVEKEYGQYGVSFSEAIVPAEVGRYVIFEASFKSQAAAMKENQCFDLEPRVGKACSGILVLGVWLQILWLGLKNRFVW